MNKIIWVYVFIILALNLDTSYSYIVSAVFMLIAFTYLFLIIIKKSKIKYSKKNIAYDSLPLILFLIWLYGVVRGLYLGNEINYIIRNFAGLSLYLIYYAFLGFRVNTNKLVKLIKHLGIYAVLLTLVMFLDTQVLKTHLIPRLPIVSNYVSGGHNVLILNQFLIFPILLISMYNIAIKSKVFKSLIIILLATFSIVIANNQGGFILGFFIYIVVFLFSMSLRKIRKENFGRLLVAIVLASSSICLILFLYFSPDTFLSNLFSLEDGGNKVRLEQIHVVVDEMNLLGHGFGAIFNSYIRNQTYPYALEITYLNLIHKLGVFSVFIFYSYAYVFIKSIRLIIKNNKTEYALIAMGLISFVFPAIANPYLFSPFVVLSHVLALLILRNISHGGIKH